MQSPLSTERAELLTASLPGAPSSRPRCDDAIPPSDGTCTIFINDGELIVGEVSPKAADVPSCAATRWKIWTPQRAKNPLQGQLRPPVYSETIIPFWPRADMRGGYSQSVVRRRHLHRVYGARG